MNFNYKLFFKYILFHTNQIFFQYFIKNNKNTLLTISFKDFYFLALHLKLSSLFYSLQLIDIFAYEAPQSLNFISKPSYPMVAKSVTVYNFHLIKDQHRFFIFVPNNFSFNLKRNNLNYFSLFSISELFNNANWLEREAHELHGIFFSGKKDLRNLMLQYGDTSTPFLKSFPSIGLREIFYDSVSDTLLQHPVTIQF